MSLDDYSLTESDREFFEKAATMIYKWLSDEEKLLLNIELRSEGFLGINDLGIKNRFFRLLNFLEVKYTRVEEWVKEINQYIEEINAVSNDDSRISEIEIKLFGDKILRFSDVEKKFLGTDLKGYFFTVLRKAELERGYKRYVDELEGTSYE